jgi:hypothetical protein
MFLKGARKGSVNVRDRVTLCRHVGGAKSSMTPRISAPSRPGTKQVRIVRVGNALIAHVIRAFSSARARSRRVPRAGPWMRLYCPAVIYFPGAIYAALAYDVGLPCGVCPSWIGMN